VSGWSVIRAAAPTQGAIAARAAAWFSTRTWFRAVRTGAARWSISWPDGPAVSQARLRTEVADRERHQPQRALARPGPPGMQTGMPAPRAPVARTDPQSDDPQILAIERYSTEPQLCQAVELGIRKLVACRPARHESCPRHGLCSRSSHLASLQDDAPFRFSSTPAFAKASAGRSISRLHSFGIMASRSAREPR
jgi:hypothetical protein